MSTLILNGDTLPGELEELNSLLPDFSHVAVHCLHDPIILTLEDGTVRQGYLTYTEGLAPETFEFELLAFSEEPCDMEGVDVFGLRNTAKLLAMAAPHLVPVVISETVAQQLRAIGVPQAATIQALLDGPSLENDEPTSEDTAKWIADGGLALMSDEHIGRSVEFFFTELQNQRVAQVEAIIEEQRKVIAEAGWSMNGEIEPDAHGAMFLYTTGLTNKGLPELVISGRFDIHDLTEILGQAAGHLLSQPRERIEENGKLKTMEFDKKVEIELSSGDTLIGVRAIEVDAAPMLHRYLKQAEAILDRPVPRVAQVQFSDSKGRYPGDAGFENIFAQFMEPEEDALPKTRGLH